MGEKQDNSKPPGGGGDDKKKDGGGPPTVVLKIDLHCEGCAKKVRRCVAAFEGVEKVNVEMEKGKVTAVGKVDAGQLKKTLEVKTHKKVVILSPTVAEPKKDGETKKEEKKADKPKEVTVVLKTLLHCDGCIHKIRRAALRFKGVVAVTIEAQKNQLCVRGTMDVKGLVAYLKDKLKRAVEVVAPKEGGEEKKKGGGGGEEKKEAGGAEKKKEEGEKKKEGGGEAKVEVNKLEHFMLLGGGDVPFAANGGGGFYQYHNQMVHNAPQMFSDENPNACSVM